MYDYTLVFNNESYASLDSPLVNMTKA